MAGATEGVGAADVPGAVGAPVPDRAGAEFEVDGLVVTGVEVEASAGLDTASPTATPTVASEPAAATPTVTGRTRASPRRR